MKKIPLEMYDKVNYMCRCYMDRTARGMFFYDSIPDTEKLRQVLECAFNKAPLLHSKVVYNPIRPYWLVCEFTPDDLLEVREVDDLEKSAEEFLNEQVHLDSPIQFMSAIFTKENKSVFCMKWSHMIMDGGGIKQFLTDLFNTYNRYLETGILEDGFSNGPRGYSEVYADMPKDKAKKAKMLLANTAKKEKKTLPFTKKGEGKDSVHLIKFGMDAETFEKARLAGKKYGATVNDVLAAAFIHAFRKITGCNNSFTLSCAVDLRRYIKNPNRLGYTNHVNFMSCSVDKIHDNIIDTLKEAAKSTKNNKKDEFLGLHAIPLLNFCYSTMIYAQAEFLIRLFYTNSNLALSNVGALDTETYRFGESRIAEAYFYGAAKNKPCAAITAMTVNGNLRMTMGSISDEKDRIMLERFFELMGEAIKEIASGYEE